MWHGSDSKGCHLLEVCVTSCHLTLSASCQSGDVDLAVLKHSWASLNVILVDHHSQFAFWFGLNSMSDFWKSSSIQYQFSVCVEWIKKGNYIQSFVCSNRVPNHSPGSLYSLLAKKINDPALLHEWIHLQSILELYICARTTKWGEVLTVLLIMWNLCSTVSCEENHFCTAQWAGAECFSLQFVYIV